MKGPQGDPPAIKTICRAENGDMALLRLEQFEAEWGKRYPAINRPSLEHVIPFFALAAGIRKMIYTITAVETQRRSLRKIKPRAFGTPLRGLGA